MAMRFDVKFKDHNPEPNKARGATGCLNCCDESQALISLYHYSKSGLKSIGKSVEMSSRELRLFIANLQCLLTELESQKAGRP